MGRAGLRWTWAQSPAEPAAAAAGPTCLPSLTRTQRLVASGVCLLMAALCFGLAALYAPVLLLRARKFALLWSLGSVLALAGGMILRAALLANVCCAARRCRRGRRCSTWPRWELRCTRHWVCAVRCSRGWAPARRWPRCWLGSADCCPGAQARRCASLLGAWARAPPSPRRYLCERPRARAIGKDASSAPGLAVGRSRQASHRGPAPAEPRTATSGSQTAQSKCSLPENL